MLISYNWLNKYFDNKLPPAEEVAEALTFHAWEIDGVQKHNDDTVIDVKIFPDKAMWGLSHRGVAKDISTILNLPLSEDPLSVDVALTPTNEAVKVKVDSPVCRRFAGALIKGVKVKESPQWLKDSFEAIDQRSINNIVDASNYVMFDLGQPSHAFDANVIGEGIHVRSAQAGETLNALDENQYTFTEDDTLITSLSDNQPLSIAGIKGGIESGISEKTTDIYVEVANWDPVTIRKTAQRLKLRSDASSRYENGIVPEMVPYGIKAVVELILQVAGGELVGFVEHSENETKDVNHSVAATLSRINSVLGVKLDVEEVSAILNRFSFVYEVDKETFQVTVPFERTDLNIAEDLIEEIGRIYGYQHIEAIVPDPIPLTELNSQFYYAEIIRETLITLGFSEIYTSSFRNEDEVKLANALATDKGYLRSRLEDNMRDTLKKNLSHVDVLGLTQVKAFEIGTVFTSNSEQLNLCFGVSSPNGYKAKTDDKAIEEVMNALQQALGITFEHTNKEGIVELNLSEIIKTLPPPESYQPTATNNITYKPFSNYPAIVRDVAMWVDENTDETEVEKVINDASGPLRLGTTLFDKWNKDGRTSYAFRLVFQSHEKTLTDSEVNAVMDDVYQAISERGFEVR